MSRQRQTSGPAIDDARSMATSGRGTGIVGYNVQMAVDAKHRLILSHEVTNVGHNRTQPRPPHEYGGRPVRQRDLSLA